MKHIYFMRHGETELNKRMRLQGRYDEPLNEKGIRQAEEAGKQIREMGIRFDRVYSSPLQRAVRTAELVTGLTKADLILDERILELDYGKFERMQFSDLPQQVWDFFRKPLETEAPETMETLEHLEERTGSFLNDLAGQADETDENWLVVCHGICMRGILSNLARGDRAEAWRSSIENCVLYETSLENGVFTKGVLVEMPGRIR
jgi:broad specificity phosphatase PhoE